MIKAIVGANWGDEGKGKITDMFAAGSDIVVRFQGGSNAGHTIINEYGKFALHQLPSGVFYDKITNVLGNGVALNIDLLLAEIESISHAKPKINLLISDKAQLVLPHHILFDQYEEERLQDRKIGSTKSGIAPFYSDKYAKTGVQLWQVYYDKDLINKLKLLYEKVNVILVNLYNQEPLDYQKIYDELVAKAEKIKPYVTDTVKFLQESSKQGKNILLEGQLGALKDAEHGIYPYVTSSSTLAANAAVGAGIAPYAITNIMAVTKAYSSAVGEGPFVSEMFGEEAETLRRLGGDGGEYGATTGRPRRVGYFDCVATRHGLQLQAATEVALTCIDVLGYMDEISVCVGYEINGQQTNDFLPTSLLYDAKPILTTLPGWKCDIRHIRKFEELPENAQKYIIFLEKQLGVPITIVSNGPKREEIIYRS